MPLLVVTTRNGATREVHGEAGLSVMAVIRHAGFDELLALCGGCCSCATCHVHVAPEWTARLPGIGPDENDLLESTSDRDDTSRLACQLQFGDALNGLAVRIAAED